MDVGEIVGPFVIVICLFGVALAVLALGSVRAEFNTVAPTIAAIIGVIAVFAVVVTVIRGYMQ